MTSPRRSSDVHRPRDMLVAGLACVAGIALALTATAMTTTSTAQAPASRTSPGPLARPHTLAHVACAACHESADGTAANPNASCTHCHDAAAHATLRAGHARMRKEGRLVCSDCHRAHGGDQTVALQATGAFVRSGGGAEVTGQLPHGSPVATVPLVPLAACARCHDPSSRTDPIAPCARALGDRSPAEVASLCMDEHQSVTDEHVHNAKAASRFAAWTAAAEVARTTPWVVAQAPSNRRTGLGWLGAGLVAAAVAMGARRKWRRRALGVEAGRAPSIAGVAPAAVRKLPVIDASTCLGCHACVDACPFDVFEVERFVAVVARPDDCCGVVLCEQACPNGSLQISTGELAEARAPVDEHLESVDVSGMFLAGDLTGMPLIKNAIRQGAAAIDRIAATLPKSARVASRANSTTREARTDDADANDADVLIVGAGPAGLAASLRAKELGLRYVTLEQATVAASIQAFPRHKLVYDQPLAVPCEGELWLRECTKEELLAQWTRVVRKHELVIREHHCVTRISKDGGSFCVETSSDSDAPDGGAPCPVVRTWRAPRIVMAIGRRGTPHTLPIDIAPGCASKVFYHLADARSLAHQRIVIVGLGDAAMEATIALASQPGTTVTVCARGEDFRRGKARNIGEMRALVRRHKIDLRFETEVTALDDAGTTLKTSQGTERIPADVLVVLIGGRPSWELLEGAGVGHGRPTLDRVDPSDPRDAQILSPSGPSKGP